MTWRDLSVMAAWHCLQKRTSNALGYWFGTGVSTRNMQALHPNEVVLDEVYQKYKRNLFKMMKYNDTDSEIDCLSCNNSLTDDAAHPFIIVGYG